MKKNSKSISRRSFIESAGAVSAGLTILPGSIVTGRSQRAPHLATQTAANAVTQAGDRNLLRASNADPAPIYVQDVYEAVLGRSVDQAERARFLEDALKVDKVTKLSLNTRNGIRVDRVFFEPGDPDGWGDQAIVYHGGEYHSFYLKLAPGRPMGHLVSKDGVFWKNAEPALECDPDILCFNTPDIHSQKAGGPYILQYTAIHPVMSSIHRVAMSENLVHWRRVEGLTSLILGGAIPKEGKLDWGWGRYEGNNVLLDGEAGHGGNLAWQEQGYSFAISCGLHLQKSKDGIHWESAGRPRLDIPTPTEKQADGSHDTVTGFFRFKDRYFLVCPSYRELRNYSRVYSSDRVDGTYQTTPHNSILGDFFAYYPRFGTAPDGSVLASVDYNESLHTWGGNGHTEYFVVPIFEKVVCDGADLWLKYWPGNDILKAQPLPLQSGPAANKGSAPLRLLTDTVDFSKGVVIECEVRIPEKSREPDLARDAKVTATGTVYPSAHPEAFLPQHAVDDRLETRWVARAGEGQPELTLDLGASSKIGRVRIHWTINWGEPEVDLQVSNDGQNWVTFPGKKHAQYVRFVSLYKIRSPVEARFLRLKNFKTKHQVVGIGSINVYEQPSEKLGANLQSPGLYVECQGGRQGWAIFLDDAHRLRMGYLNADGSSYNYEIERDLQFYGLGERVKFRLIQRGRFFHFYLNDFAMSWISLREEPSGRVGILNDAREDRVTAIRAWAAQRD